MILISSKPQMPLLLKGGHKINKPVPLFTKIEQSVIDELKKKYGGVQQAKDATPKPEKSKLFNNVAEAEQAVADQGEKVRKLKTSGVEKAVWQPEVTILLELKKQLANLQAQKDGGSASKEVSSAAAPVSSADDIKKLEAEIAQQVS
jgi:methionyl-tRNA synthetase